MEVELVSVETSDGVRLDGYLRSRRASTALLGVDLVICHHGVGGNFYGASFFDRMGDALLDHGSAILRVNNRGHDQAFQVSERRLGAAYELIDHCRRDITAWLDFGQRRGFRRMALWGHSLGAVKTVYFLGTENESRVVCAVASSPPRFSHQAYLSGPNAARFAADIERAHQLVGAGKPDDLLEALVPVARPFSARTYLDKYGPQARFDYFDHLSNVRVPLLLTLGSLERAEMNFAPLAEEGPTLAARWPDIAYQLIQDADHSYAERTRELWLAVSAWLKGAAVPTTAR